MSILIKGMEMPKDIASNVHRTITLIISGDGTIYDVDRNQLPYEAVEIKETHGRLIDADKFMKPFYDLLEKDEHSLDYYSVSYGGLKVMIDNAPTVIESEEQEHETSE